MSPPPTRILIVRIGAMGDVLHALPAAAGLRQAIPDCTIAWAVEPRWAPLLLPANGPGPIVDHIHPVPARHWQAHPLAAATEIAALRRNLRAARYDLCVDLQGAIKSAIVGKLAAAKHFLGPDQPRETPARLLYQQRVPCAQPHVIDQACELLSAAVPQSIQAKPILPAPIALPADPTSDAWCTAALVRAGIPPGIPARFVLLAPGAGWGAKQWGTQHFAAIAARMRQAGFGVIVNAPATGPEAALADQIAHTGGGQTLPCTITQLIALTRRADLVIGGDTGPVHLAAALGRPVVALFGPTDPARTGPRFPGSHVTILRHPTSQTSHKRIAQTEPGLATITVDQVEAAASALLGATPEVTLA